MSRVIFWWSHGSTSTAAVLKGIPMVREMYPDREIEIVCCMLEEEHEHNHKVILPQYDAFFRMNFGVGIKVLTNEKYKGESGFGSVNEVIRLTRYMSGPAGARCTKELKKQVRIDYQRHDDIHVFGFHSKEAHRVDQLMDNENELEIFAPLIDLDIDKQDAIDMLQSYGFEIPMMYQLGYNNNNPCTLDTRVTTTKGVYEIGELLDTTVKMYGRDGVVDADIRYMGEQPVLELKVSKKGMDDKSLRFTPDHKWYNVSRRGKRFNGETIDLRVGDFLPVCDFGGVDFELDVNHVLWGFCVGDGNINGDNSAIRAFGEKWKALESIGVQFTSHNESLDMKYLGMLPKYYKTQVIDSSDRMDVKMSFLVGWFLADGSCNINGQTCISTSDHVDELRELLSSCGIPVTSIVEVSDSGNLNKNGVKFERTKECMSINFRAPKSLMLKESHVNNYKENKQSVRGWRIDSITDVGVHPVACATVVNGLPEFTLEDMILTGNCIGCVKASGAGYWNKIRIDFPEVFETRSRQEYLLGTSLVSVSANKFAQNYPDVMIKMLEESMDPDIKYKISIKSNGQLRMPLRFLPEDLGDHKTEHSFECGIFCERDG